MNQVWEKEDIARIKLQYYDDFPESLFGQEHSDWFDTVKQIDNQIVILTRQRRGNFTLTDKPIMGWETNINWKFGEHNYIWVPEMWLIKVNTLKIITGLCDDCGGINRHEKECQIVKI
jgi:hypothetical protein